MARRRCVCRNVARIHRRIEGCWPHGLGRTFHRRELCFRKKRGADVGKTKRGKGTKWISVEDGQGKTWACSIHPASPSEMKLAPETLKQTVRPEGQTFPLIADKGYDSDPLRDQLAMQGIDLICPHRANRKKRPRQDKPKLRHCKRRWIIERTIS
ncbi:MAG: transposase [Planctomycetota bacterium]